MPEKNDPFEDAIKRHFEHNGTFDPEKGRSAMNAALQHYRKSMKRVERVTYGYLAATVVVALIAVSRFTSPGAGVKELIAWAVLFLFAIQTQVLMKLWYWVMNVKTGILREIKLGQLSGAAAGMDEGGEVASPPVRLSDASRLERWARIGGLAAVALATLYFFPLHGNFDAPDPGSSMQCEQTVTLGPGGSVQSEARFSLPNTGAFPMESLSLYSDASDYEMAYEDFMGRSIPVTSAPEGQGERSQLKLPEPIMPGDRLFLKRRASSEGMATLRDGIWTWVDGQSWGYDTSRYDYVVTLPAGAELISATPRPWCTTRESDAQSLHIRATRNSGEQLKIEVQYRLPGESGAAGTRDGVPPVSLRPAPILH